MKTLASFTVILICFTLTLALTGCGSATDPAISADGKVKVQLALNWVPEPEFGGFYAALEEGDYASENLDVTIKPGGTGTATIMSLASGAVPFAIVSADEVVIARSRGAKIVAIYATYQTCPQGIMVHQESGIDSIQKLMNTPGSIAMEPGLAYAKFIQKKYPPAPGVNIVPYTGGVAQFLNSKTYSQQCFIFSEPISARRNGANPNVLLVADEGYNPYTVVLATNEDFLDKHPQVVKAFVKATQKGWDRYLTDPTKANAVMARLNATMDAQTFIEAASVQIPLVRTEETSRQGLGIMTRQRWETLASQLVDLGIIESPPDAMQCFRNMLD